MRAVPYPLPVGSKTDKKMSTYLSLSFFNGENYPLDHPLITSVINEVRPLPLLISFGCYIEGTAKQYFFTTRFDYAELKAAFDKLGAADALVNIEIEPQLPKGNTKVRLYNSKGSVDLKKIKTN